MVASGILRLNNEIVRYVDRIEQAKVLNKLTAIPEFLKFIAGLQEEQENRWTRLEELKQRNQLYINASPVDPINPLY